MEIWEWCIQRKFTIHAGHLAGGKNIRVDWLSCHLMDWSDWRLKMDVFLELAALRVSGDHMMLSDFHRELSQCD